MCDSTTGLRESVDVRTVSSPRVWRWRGYGCHWWGSLRRGVGISSPATAQERLRSMCPPRRGTVRPGTGGRTSGPCTKTACMRLNRCAGRSRRLANLPRVESASMAGGPRQRLREHFTPYGQGRGADAGPMRFGEPAGTVRPGRGSRGPVGRAAPADAMT